MKSYFSKSCVYDELYSGVNSLEFYLWSGFHIFVLAEVNESRKPGGGREGVKGRMDGDIIKL